MTQPIADITDHFEGVNAYDRIYQSPHGFTVKVRVEDVSPSPSILTFLVTGAWAEDETGRAKEFGDGHFIVEPHEVTVRSDSPVDLEALISAGREQIVARVDAAAVNYAARVALTGVKPKASSAPLETEPSPSAALLET